MMEPSLLILSSLTHQAVEMRMEIDAVAEGLATSWHGMKGRSLWSDRRNKEEILSCRQDNEPGQNHIWDCRSQDVVARSEATWQSHTLPEALWDHHALFVRS